MSVEEVIFMYNNELYHFGVKGMKWGVRRYQNKDGSLTPKGKKRYGKMSDDKLQKTLYKQVKKKRAEQTNWSNQWMVGNTIGKHSKAAQDKFDKDKSEYANSDAYKQAQKKLRKLQDRYESGKVDADQYDVEFEKIWDAVSDRPDLQNFVTISHEGRKYSQAYLDKYGKDINIGYLKDLGYNESVAKEFAERVMRGRKKMLDGM